MLHRVITHLTTNRMDYHVLDDGSDNFDPGSFVPADRLTRFRHGGKRKFWTKFAMAFEICKASEHDTFLFMPDDHQDLRITELLPIAEAWQESQYCINLANDGRTSCWGFYRMGLRPIETDHNKLIEVGFCDCGFMTSRKTIEQINIQPIPDTWFDRPDKSSGVGSQLTMTFRRLGVPMLVPERSFVYHGDHESMMHGKHRTKVKLISK
jgi:hypothetical protein